MRARHAKKLENVGVTCDGRGLNNNEWNDVWNSYGVNHMSVGFCPDSGRQLLPYGNYCVRRISLRTK